MPEATTSGMKVTTKPNVAQYFQPLLPPPPPLNTYSGSNIRLTLMPRFTPLKARNESLPLSTSSESELTGLSAALIVQIVL